MDSQVSVALALSFVGGLSTSIGDHACQHIQALVGSGGSV
ncbi:hypothetical protein ZOSMA_7G01900 [Zostera marina]|uniref:Uncharacterized protein n=1 Tax=Zostera marina TaxID=29655 RepID=A0A0K9NQ19_ZOSMR|nr:hypothetical protein ZOSMA_7G01900 [Zostera marina]